MKLIARNSILLALGSIAANLALAAELLAHKHAVQLAGVTTAYTQGDTVGVIQSGAACASDMTREWSPLLQQRVQTELSHAFKDQVAANRSLATGDLSVNANVNEIKVQLCDLGKGAWRGGFHVQVSWQLKPRGAKQPSFQTTTAGVFDSAQIDQVGPTGSGLRAAFATAVHKLLADRQFVAALNSAPEFPARQVADATRL